MELTATARLGYERLFASMKINPSRRTDFQGYVNRIVAGKAKYAAVEAEIGVPWYVVGLLHTRESNCNFNTYLGNGQTLMRRTTIVPRGRGPFPSWQAGALDALKLQGFHLIKEWDLATILYSMERFNGFGYAAYGVNSPYMWAGSNLYTSGKYIADGVFSKSAVDTQPGVACMLQILIMTGLIPALANKVIPMVVDAVTNAVLPTPIAGPFIVKPTAPSSGVTVNIKQHLALDTIKVLGVLLGTFGLTQWSTWVGPETMIGGFLVTALAMVLSGLDLNGSNDNTFQFVDNMESLLLRVLPAQAAATQNVSAMQTMVSTQTPAGGTTTVTKTDVHADTTPAATPAPVLAAAS